MESSTKDRRYVNLGNWVLALSETQRPHNVKLTCRAALQASLLSKKTTQAPVTSNSAQLSPVRCSGC